MIYFLIMDCVYICRPGDNEELKYSIRSVVKNLTHNNIWLVGYKPEWYIGNYIQVEDKSIKFENIRKCLSVVTEIGGISDNFTLMNDDFYLIKPMGIVPTYHGGYLDDKIARYIAQFGSTKYTRILADASKQLKKRGIERPLDYDIHTPMIMNKEHLKEVIELGMAPRSMYGNVFSIGGIEIKDVKLYKHNNEIDYSSGIISTEDRSLRLVENMLKDLFSEPTDYEKRI